MLRIRSIHYNAFRSSKLAALSAEAERCWWRLQCLCDDDGRTEDDPEVICGFLFPKRRDFTPEMVDGWVQELHDAGLIVRYAAGGAAYLCVNQWHDYQHPRRPQTSRIPAPPSRRVATSPDMSRHVLQESSGVGEGGESEGNPTQSPPVDNPIAQGLAARAEAISQQSPRLELVQTPATGATA